MQGRSRFQIAHTAGAIGLLIGIADDWKYRWNVQPLQVA